MGDVRSEIGIEKFGVAVTNNASDTVKYRQYLEENTAILLFILVQRTHCI